MFDIQFNFINRSVDLTEKSIVIFQENIAESFQETAVAWTVLNGVGLNDSSLFWYSSKLELAVSDYWGHISQVTEVSPGNAYELVQDLSGDVIRKSSRSVANPYAIEMWNGQENNVVNGNCLREGKLLATKRAICPREKAVFEFQPTIAIGVTSKVEEGDEINLSHLKEMCTIIPLGHMPIKTADIVMTGGGTGPDATPYEFSLENICRV